MKTWVGVWGRGGGEGAGTEVAVMCWDSVALAGWPQEKAEGFDEGEGILFRV